MDRLTKLKNLYRNKQISLVELVSIIKKELADTPRTKDGNRLGQRKRKILAGLTNQ